MIHAEFPNNQHFQENSYNMRLHEGCGCVFGGLSYKSKLLAPLMQTQFFSTVTSEATLIEAVSLNISSL